ncbi:hypothetical protein [Burkholderia territorii]|nr:hypothetical protein [Burkholderia territorii]MBM2774916.1 hypothetical protein [Burkholderia territorii]VWB72226.1 hypothetical protein BTE28158_03402 [Burkholderia territorii]
MKTIFCVLAAAFLCAACANGGAGTGERGGSLEMYGTIDQGITVRR